MTAGIAHAREPAALSFPSAEAIRARAAGENFAVASLLVGRRHARHLLAIYGFARLVDELGDAADGDRLALLELLEAELDEVLDGHPRHPLLVDLATTVRECRLPRGPFERLIEANRRDQLQSEYATFADLVGYCTLSADPVGELVLHVFDVATPERVALSDDVCTALQIVEHCQDVGEDAARGRIYLPADDRARFGVTREQLTASTTAPQVRRLVELEVGRASELLASGAELVASLRGRARIAVAGYVGGGRATIDSLAACDFDVLTATRRASRRRRAWATVRTHRGAW
jgi:squalene synthase HpnC